MYSMMKEKKNNGHDKALMRLKRSICNIQRKSLYRNETQRNIAQLIFKT